MSRSKTHKCYTQMNKLLKEKNVRLQNMFNPNQLVVSSAKIDKKKRTQSVAVLATYCPFCGEKVLDT